MKKGNDDSLKSLEIEEILFASHQYCKDLMKANPLLSFGETYDKTILWAVQQKKSEVLKVLDEIDFDDICMMTEPEEETNFKNKLKSKIEEVFGK